MDDINFNPEAQMQGKLDRAANNIDAKSRKQAKEATEQFEAIFAQILLSSMRKAMAPDGMFGEGAQGDIFQGLLEEKLSGVIAQRGQLGIADMLRRQLNIPTELPTLDKLSPEELDEIIDRASEKFGVDKKLIHAVIQQESGGNPAVVSHAGAKGLMQLMDSTAAELGVQNAFNPEENVFAGTRYLKEQLENFGDLELALAAYNAGPGAVGKYNGIPPFEETQNYVKSIMNRLERSGED